MDRNKTHPLAAAEPNCLDDLVRLTASMVEAARLEAWDELNQLDQSFKEALPSSLENVLSSADQERLRGMLAAHLEIENHAIQRRNEIASLLAQLKPRYKDLAK